MLLNENDLIMYLYYGKCCFNVQYSEETLIIDILDEITFKRRESFYVNYTSKELNLLPNDFYAYYNKHIKILKEERYFFYGGAGGYYISAGKIRIYWK